MQVKGVFTRPEAEPLVEEVGLVKTSRSPQEYQMAGTHSATRYRYATL